MKIRAKFRCDEVKKTEYSEEVKLQAVCGTSPEDNSFSQATPCATVTMSINNKNAHGAFVPGQKYYADFTPAAE